MCSSDLLHSRGHYSASTMRLELARTDWDNASARRFTELVVKTCEVCQMWKRRRFREDLGFIEAKEVSDVVAVDVLGPLSQHARAPSKLILVAVDYFSRWVETRTVRSPT